MTSASLRDAQFLRKVYRGPSPYPIHIECISHVYWVRGTGFWVGLMSCCTGPQAVSRIVCCVASRRCALEKGQQRDQVRS